MYLEGFHISNWLSTSDFVYVFVVVQSESDYNTSTVREVGYNIEGRKNLEVSLPGSRTAFYALMVEMCP